MRRLAIILILLLVVALVIGTVGCGEDGKDSDGDGWTDAQEQSAGTSPYTVDTDGDGYWDPQDPNPLDSNIPAAGSTPTVTATVTPTRTPTPVPSGISWDEGKYHIGERTTVCGPVVDTHYASTSSGQPTFLNVGKSYPDTDRFTVVIWGRNRSNFPAAPESYYYGKSVCVTGLITEYQGVAQIEASSPSQIQEY